MLLVTRQEPARNQHAIDAFACASADLAAIQPIADASGVGVRRGCQPEQSGAIDLAGVVMRVGHDVHDARARSHVGACDSIAF